MGSVALAGEKSFAARTIQLSERHFRRRLTGLPKERVDACIAASNTNLYPSVPVCFSTDESSLLSARLNGVPLHKATPTEQSRVILKLFAGRRSQIIDVGFSPQFALFLHYLSSRNICERFFFEKRNIELIHGDLHSDNVLYQDSEVFVVDWLESGLGFLEYDYYCLLMSPQLSLQPNERMRVLRSLICGADFSKAILFVDFKIHSLSMENRRDYVPTIKTFLKLRNDLANAIAKLG